MGDHAHLAAFLLSTSGEVAPGFLGNIAENPKLTQMSPDETKLIDLKSRDLQTFLVAGKFQSGIGPFKDHLYSNLPFTILPIFSQGKKNLARRTVRVVELSQN